MVVDKLKPYAKAVIGGLVTGLGSLGAAWAGDHVIDTGEWIAAAVLALSTLGAVYAVPNRPVTGK